MENTSVLAAYQIDIEEEEEEGKSFFQRTIVDCYPPGSPQCTGGLRETGRICIPSAVTGSLRTEASLLPPPPPPSTIVLSQFDSRASTSTCCSASHARTRSLGIMVPPGLLRGAGSCPPRRKLQLSCPRALRRGCAPAPSTWIAFAKVKLRGRLDGIRRPRKVCGANDRASAAWSSQCLCPFSRTYSREWVPPGQFSGL